MAMNICRVQQNSSFRGCRGGLRGEQSEIGNMRSKISLHNEISVSTAAGQAGNLCMWLCHDSAPAQLTHAVRHHLDPAIRDCWMGEWGITWPPLP